MGKKRPTLGTFANPVSTFVTPVAAENTVEPLNQQAIRETYAFADAFSDLSESMVKVASTIKTEMNVEEVRAGQEKVNSSRRTYAQLVQSGQINPSENPWMAIGAQKASGVLEASQARNKFKEEYDRAISNNPELLKDNTFFDALASSFAQNKAAEFGSASYLSEAFFDQFNPQMVSMSAEHASNVGKYRQGKIIESLKVKVNEALQNVSADRGFGRRQDGSQKDIGWEGVMYDLDGNAVTEKSITVELDGLGEISIPMIVPGLSTATKEKIVYENATLDDLPIEDQKHIIDHAIGQLQKGRTPFFDTEDRLDQLVPEVQAYMDEQGQNTGMPRMANMATAMHLIELMKSSSMTYEAEKMLRQLQAGTGPLSETSDVKSMLVDAKADIDKNRFELQANKEKQVVGLFMENAYNAAFDNATSGNPDEGYGPAYDELTSQLLPQLQTMGPVERAKVVDQFNERWNNATREGTESLEKGQVTNIRNFAQQRIVEMRRNLKGPVLDWMAFRREHNERVRIMGIPATGPQSENARKAAVAVVNAQLADMRIALEAAAGNDRVQQDRNRQLYKLNEIQASLAFDLEDRLEDIRSIALNGISIDVERGLRPELADLINIYANLEGGQGPIDLVLSKGERGKRTLEFLRQVRLKSDYMPMPDAVRDAAQALNLDSESSILALTDIKENGADMEALRKRIDTVQGQMIDSWWPMGFGETPLNPDSRTALSSMFIRKFMDSMNQTRGAFNTSLEEATAFVYENAMLVNNSVLPKNAFGPNFGPEYISAFIDVEVGPNSGEKGIALVWVGNGGNGAPVFALRDAQGNRVKDTYYTVNDIVTNERPRDPETGEVIPNTLSPFERVSQELGRRENARKFNRFAPSLQPNRDAKTSGRIVIPSRGSMK